MMRQGAVLFLVWVLAISRFSDGYSPRDSYLIDCGSSTNTTVGGRVFVADSLASKLLSTPKNVLASISGASGSSDVPQLYQTARIFTSTSTYTFSISQGGRHWIRLHFAPFDYNGYKMSMANFGVLADGFVLLSDFSTTSKVMKEFSLNVTSDTLGVTITPSGQLICLPQCIGGCVHARYLDSGWCEPSSFRKISRSFADGYRDSLEDKYGRADCVLGQ
ncbi:hypothetical protein MLD38_017325 [Melastoma candidum]|uniref:Uncharacterized protein n=1 Tax=Melastoma candidum TaxID=119954 RepID=A0ACB9QTC8_9MYRT|nr:hypothetical protein MLD38_017325 [Melastoma candidum]